MLVLLGVGKTGSYMLTGKTADAVSLEEKLLSRMENQVKLLVEAQARFVQLAGKYFVKVKRVNRH